MVCLMVGGDKSCKNHNVVSMQEINDNFLEDIIDITPKVDETYKRLTKTAVDVGHLLHNIENETTSSELTQMLADVKQHFSKLAAAIQKHEKEVVDIIVKLKCSERESLHKAKDDLANGIKKAKTVLHTINSCSNPVKAKQMNLSVLLDEAKQIVEMPWYLSRDESTDPLKVAVNEDVCTLVSDYIHLEGNANTVYKLRRTADLAEGVEIPPPPPAPVYPPELPKDVRLMGQSGSDKVPPKAMQPPGFYKSKPKYRTKSGSVSSLNSIQSDCSDSNTGYVGEGFQNYQRPVVQSVQPFAESQHPKQLHEGSQELIYISHIVDPHNFFVQRSCHQGLVKEMLREFRNASTLPKPSLNHVAEGKVYLVFNKADNMWQRCRVVTINRKDNKNPTFLVFCIDFGSTETVTIEKLRLLPPARVQSPYPLAINCSLANCEPKISSWTSDDAYLIQNIVDNKQAVIHVRHIRSTSNFTVTLEVDVTTFEDGISLAHALVFHERARMPRPKLPYPKINAVMERPKIFLSNNDLKPKSVEEVFITHIVSPDKFFVRKRHLMQVFDKLCEELDQEYSNSNTGTVYLPEIGMSCVVNVEKSPEAVAGAGVGGGGRWVRGVVSECPGRGRVRLQLPDTGAALLVHWTALRHILPQYTTQRALATEVHLAGVTPLNKKWSPASVALLQRFQERPLRLHVEEARRGSPGVTLYDASDPDEEVCVNTQLIKHKFAVTFGLFMFNKNSVEDQVFTNKSPLEEPKQRPKPAGQIQVLQRKAPNKLNEKELDAKDKGPLRLEAKVLHYHSPSLLYISLVHQQKAFSELFEEIQKHYSKKKTQGKEEWAVGDRCCTFCQQSQTWRRAVIVELQGENAKVFYSDFACVETVPLASLKELTTEFTIGDAAIKCHLSGIVPADGGEEWPTITKEYLKELLDAYPRVFVTKLGDFKNKSMPVEVWVYHTIQGGALEPNKSEWRCLNKKIIEQGLGIPDKTQEASSSTEGTKNDMLSFLKNVTGSVDEWLQLEPVPMKPVSKSDTPTNSSSPMDEEDENTPNELADVSDTVFITDWLPPEPLPCKEFTAMPTYIDNDGLIYLHDMTQQDTLDLIRKALDVRFKSPDPKAKYAKWTVGEPCIAMYYLDNRFYRGRVLEVNPDTSSCIIHYIDYGNEENCSFENMRKSIALYQIPTQAHKCSLSRIRPVGVQWDRQTLDYIHKSIVEKHCFVKVVGEPVEGVVPIELKYDKLWINDHLVDFEMAVYTDGSKAVVRKFSANKKNKVLEVPIVIEHDSSGPDYIIEEEIDIKTMEGKDWNALIEDEETNSIVGKFCTYPKNNLKEFLCNIVIINDVRTLELTIIHNDETNIIYEEMFERIQQEGPNLPPLNGIYEHKACIALFPEDGRWYRASILQHSESKGRLKVKYVDYGNIDIISLADAREISDEWTELPTGTITAQLSGVTINPEIEVSVLSEIYAKTFLDKGPFCGKVIYYENDIPNVELRNDSDELVYEDLIQKGIFLKVDYSVAG
ncbi:tudor domain-containing protein 1 [Pectinophora gossypiella]|nr:tudor domain-containing protein 1 [Pectinophora gossypiella]